MLPIETSIPDGYRMTEPGPLPEERRVVTRLLLTGDGTELSAATPPREHAGKILLKQYTEYPR